MKRILDITLPFKAMSINHYQKSTRSGRRYITNKGKAYTSSILMFLPYKMDCSFPFYSVKIIAWYEGFYTKKGEVSSRVNDCDNGVKIIQDTIFKKYGLNDKFVVSNPTFKLHGKDKIRVVIYGLTEEDFKNLTKEVENDD